VLVQGVLAQVKAVLWLEATASLYASEFCCQQLLGHGSSILFLFGSVLFCCSVLPHGWQECGKSVARVWVTPVFYVPPGQRFGVNNCWGKTGGKSGGKTGGKSGGKTGCKSGGNVLVKTGGKSWSRLYFMFPRGNVLVTPLRPCTHTSDTLCTHPL
jgi:hypothetical protein